MHLVSHLMVGTLHLVMHGRTGNLDTPRLRDRAVPLFFQIILLLRFWRKVTLQKDVHSQKGSYSIEFLQILVMPSIFLITGIEYSKNFKAAVT